MLKSPFRGRSIKYMYMYVCITRGKTRGRRKYKGSHSRTQETHYELTNSRLSVRESHRQVIFNNDFACGGKRRDYKEKRRRRTFIDLKGNLSEIINCIQNRVITVMVIFRCKWKLFCILPLYHSNMQNKLKLSSHYWTYFATLNF